MAHNPWRGPVAISPVAASSLRPAPWDARPRDRVRSGRRPACILKDKSIDWLSLPRISRELRTKCLAERDTPRRSQFPWRCKVSYWLRGHGWLKSGRGGRGPGKLFSPAPATSARPSRRWSHSARYLRGVWRRQSRGSPPCARRRVLPIHPWLCGLAVRGPGVRLAAAVCLMSLLLFSIWTPIKKARAGFRSRLLVSRISLYFKNSKLKGVNPPWFRYLYFQLNQPFRRKWTVLGGLTRFGRKDVFPVFERSAAFPNSVIPSGVEGPCVSALLSDVTIITDARIAKHKQYTQGPSTSLGMTVR